MVRIRRMLANNTKTPTPDAGSELFIAAAACVPPERRVSFETPVILRRKLRSICGRADYTVRIVVTGITEEALDKISQPFRTDNVSESGCKMTMESSRSRRA